MNSASRAPIVGPGAPWRAFVGAVTVVTLLNLVGKLFGFAEKLLLAYYEGTSAAVDSYFTAVGLGVFFFILTDDILVPVFLAQYVALREAVGQGTATALFRRVTAWTALVLVVLSGLAQIFPSQFVQLVAPGFSPEQVQSTIGMLRYTLIGGVLLGLGGVLYVLLNAHGRFAWPALAGVAHKALIPLTIAALYPMVGMTGAAIALVVAASGQLLLLVVGVRKWIPKAEPQPLESGFARNFLWLMVPLAVGTIAAQSGLFVDNAMGSILESGSIAALSFSRRLVELPVVLLPTALGVVAFPQLARLAAAGQPGEMMQRLAAIMRFSVLVFLPLTAVFLLASEELVYVVFARGEFDASSVDITAQVARFYCLGLVAFALEILVLRAFYATLDTRTPILVGLVFLALNITATLTLTPKLGLLVIPVALAAQKTAKTAVLAWILARRHSSRWISPLTQFVVRASLAAGGFAIVFAQHRWLAGHVYGGHLAELAIAGTVAGLLYLIALSRLGLLDVRAVRHLLSEST